MALKDVLKRWLGIDEIKENQIELEDSLIETGIIDEPITVESYETDEQLEQAIHDSHNEMPSEFYSDNEPIDDWFDL